MTNLISDKHFAIPYAVDNLTYNRTGNLYDILKNSDDRKELLKRGYDPSVKPTQRVIGNKIIKSTSESNGDPYVREYLNEDAIKKSANDKIMNDYIAEKEKENFGRRSKRYFDIPRKHSFASNFIQGFELDNPNTHFRVVKPSGEYDYHGYHFVPDKHRPAKGVHNINGLDYEINTSSNAHLGQRLVDFGTKSGGYKITNKPENMRPLFNAVGDELVEQKPLRLEYSGDHASGNLDGSASKHNANRKSYQRELLYKRKLKNMFPEIDENDPRNLENADWRKLATKSQGFSIVFDKDTRLFSVNHYYN